MIRRLLRRLFGPSGDIYVVVDTGYAYRPIVGVSARQQGAERIRAEYAEWEAKNRYTTPAMLAIGYQQIYDRTIIENHELQDTE